MKMAKISRIFSNRQISKCIPKKTGVPLLHPQWIERRFYFQSTHLAGAQKLPENLPAIQEQQHLSCFSLLKPDLCFAPAPQFRDLASKFHYIHLLQNIFQKFDAVKTFNPVVTAMKRFGKNLFIPAPKFSQ